MRGVANVALLLAAASCTAFGTAAVRDGRKEGGRGGKKGEPRDEVSVGEVVEVGQSGGKRDVWSETSGDLGWLAEEREEREREREMEREEERKRKRDREITQRGRC